MMKKSINFFVLLVVFATLFASVYSCKLKTVEPGSVDIGYDYYPLEIGRYIIYDEHDVIYNPIKTIDTVYQVKELIKDTIVEGTETKYLIYHFVKSVTDSIWPIQPDSVWTAVNTGNQLIREESNVEYIKLVFPVKEGKTWNGNAMNYLSQSTSSNQFYSMVNVNQPCTISLQSYPNQPYSVTNTTYNNTLKMIIINQADSIVSKDIRFDIYAKGIGYIKKDYTTYFYVQDPAAAPQTIDHGARRLMQIRSYGKE
jgi:hypothetical protein